MTQVVDDVIEVGSDGAFDLDAAPPPPAPKHTPKPPSKSKSKISTEGSNSDTPADWEMKKQRGNRAFEEGNVDLSIDCYTSAISTISDLIEKDGADGASPAKILRPSKVALLSNRALCFLKRAEAAEAAAGLAAALKPLPKNLPPSPLSSSSPARTDPVWTSAAASSMAHQAGLARPTKRSQALWRRCAHDAAAALALDPGHAKALFRHSRALMALGSHSKAVQAARLAKRASPKAKDIVAWEAWARALESEREAAMAATVTGGKAIARGNAGSGSGGGSNGGGDAEDGEQKQSRGGGNGRGGGGGDASGAVAEQAGLEAAAAYLHVLGATSTHTNATSTLSSAPTPTTKAAGAAGGSGDGGRVAWGGGNGDDEKLALSKRARDWRRGPRDATEGALFAACRSVALALHGRSTAATAPTAGGGGRVGEVGVEATAAAEEEARSEQLCRDVAGAAARLAGGGLATLLPTHDPRRSRNSSSSARLFTEEGRAHDDADDETTAQGASLRALRATMAALLTPWSPPPSSSTAEDGGKEEEEEEEGGAAGLVTEEAALRAAAVAACTASMMKSGVGSGGNAVSVAQEAAEHARVALVLGAGLDAATARDLAGSLLGGGGTGKQGGGGGRGGNERGGGGGIGDDGDDKGSPEEGMERKDAKGQPRFLPSARFEGAKEGYVFSTRGSGGTGYFLDDGPTGAAARWAANRQKKTSLAGGVSYCSSVEDFEDPKHPMLAALPSEDAREGVRRLLRMPNAELSKLPVEQQEQVEKIKDLYKQQAEFAKQSQEAAKTRARQETEALAALARGEDVAVGPDGKPLLAPDGKPMKKSHHPRDGPPGSVEAEELARIQAGGGLHPGGAGAAALSSSEKAAKRRADEVKWLEEFSAKEGKRQQASASAVVTRAEWEEANARRKAEAASKEEAESDARRACARKEVEAMRSASAFETASLRGGGGGSAEGSLGGKAAGGLKQQPVAQSQKTRDAAEEAAAAAASSDLPGVSSEAGDAHDKKRENKVKKKKKKERSAQFDDIRRLAQSASVLSFAD